MTNRRDWVVLSLGLILGAGAASLYPALRLAEIYDGTGIRTTAAPDSIHEQTAFGGTAFSLSLDEVLEPDPQRR